MAEREGVEGLAPRVVQAEAMIHVPAGGHLQHGGSPHDEVEPCDRKVGKEYKTEKPKGEGERRCVLVSAWLLAFREEGSQD